MMKFLQSLALVVALVWGGSPDVQAAVVTNTTDQLFNAVGESSSTLRVNPSSELSVFVSGTYAAGNTVVLQRGVGSPGSGAFENVVTVTSGTANARVVTRWPTGPNPESYRLLMTATGTGAVVAYLTDKNVTATTGFVSDSAQIVMFDDFVGDNSASPTVLNASKYLTTDGDTQAGTLGARTADVEEGTVQMNAGTTDITDGICLSFLAIGPFGALPSDGPIIFETRLQAEQVDGLVYMTLQAQECTALNTVVTMIDMDSGVVLQLDASNADMIGIARQDEATDTDDWQAFSSLVDTEGANALEVPLGVVGVATEYDTLRVETDTAGNGYFYVNGTLLHAEALAVTPGTRLLPSIFVSETAANGGAVEIHVDYILYVVPRPAS